MNKEVHIFGTGEELLPQELILQDIIFERARQDEKWGPQRDHSDYKWATILGEEFGEACKEVFDTEFFNTNNENLRKELIQVAAVAVVWIEALDSRNE